MCNRYLSPDEATIRRNWSLRTARTGWSETSMYPRATGSFLRRQADENVLVLGQWGLIPSFATARTLKYATHNARSETIATKPSFRQAWARQQRCIIPAVSFDEPCWETGHNVWWRFTRTDGTPWGLAGLWDRWCDPASGEVLESYTLLTLNADAHPLMRRMHKPDPRLPPEAQDKRSVLVIEAQDVDTWLTGSLAEARSLVRLAPETVFRAEPLTAHA